MTPTQLLPSSKQPRRFFTKVLPCMRKTSLLVTSSRGLFPPRSSHRSRPAKVAILSRQTCSSQQSTDPKRPRRTRTRSQTALITQSCAPTRSSRPTSRLCTGTRVARATVRGASASASTARIATTSDPRRADTGLVAALRLRKRSGRG